MRDVLPPEILHRRKHGFGLPLDRWFRSELRPYLQGMLGSAGGSVRNLVEPQALDAMVAEHMAGSANHGHALWSLLTLEVFLRREGW
jgi:asparagine synthase (glutamine-hydrolysing)